jgi:uncharacterized repeat protein (TIGR03803 family)
MWSNINLAITAAAFTVTFAAATESAAATYTKIYSFCAQVNCADGAQPRNSVTIDADGNLYGVTTGGGDAGSGTVFALKKRADGYTYRRVYSFCSKANCADGRMPSGRLIVDVNGALYGLTSDGGKFGGGVAYELIPNARKTRWKFQALYDFCRKPSCVDGSGPGFALTYQGAESGAPYDGMSPLFGAGRGGKYGGGVAFRLTLVEGQPKRKEDVIYDFCAQPNCDDGASANGLIPDAAGNLFGTTASGGAHFGGVLFKLTPKANGRFKETVLYPFCSQTNCTDGSSPLSQLVFGPDGSLNGTTVQGGANNNGTVFGFLPSTSTETVLYSFCEVANCADGTNPLTAGVAIDADGVMFGTTAAGGANSRGVAYSLNSGTEQVLKSFCEEQNCTDGTDAIDGVTLDSSGNAFGTAQSGGDNSSGVVFEIQP